MRRESVDVHFIVCVLHIVCLQPIARLKLALAKILEEAQK